MTEQEFIQDTIAAGYSYEEAKQILKDYLWNEGL